VKIRVFEARDTDAVIALWQRSFPEYADPAKPQRDPRVSIANKLATQPELFFVGEVGARVIGTIMAGYDGHRGWLYSLAVAEEMRGKGFGRVLIVVHYQNSNGFARPGRVTTRAGRVESRRAVARPSTRSSARAASRSCRAPADPPRRTLSPGR